MTQIDERFAPSLVSEYETHPRPEGGVALWSPASSAYALVDVDQLGFLSQIDGHRDLSAIVLAAAIEGHRLAPSRLLELVDKLRRAGLLQGQTAEPPARTWPVLATPGFGRLLSSTLGGAGRAVAHRGALAVTLLGLVVAALLLLDPNLVPGRGLVGGSYAVGMLELLIGVVAVLSALHLGRALALAGWGLPIHRAGIALPLPWFVVDGRHALRGGRRAELDIHCNAIAGAFGAAALLGGASWAVGGGSTVDQALCLAAFGGMSALWLLLCPVGRTDTGQAFDLAVPGREGRRDALSYLHRRVLRRQGAQAMFEGEGHHLLFATALVLWVFVGIRGSSRFLATQGSTLTEVLLGQGNAVDRIVAVAVIAVTVASLLGSLVLAAFRLVAALRGHMPERKPQVALLTPDPAGARAALAACPLFAGVDDTTRDALVQEVEPVAAVADQLLVREGDEGDRFFIVGSGSMWVYRTAPSGREVSITTLGPGDCFGEIALLDGGRRTASVRALEPSLLFSLGRDRLIGALQASGIPRSEVTTRLRTAQTIRQSSLFAHLAPQAVMRLAGALDRRTVAAGTVLMLEGEPGDSFYLLEAGTLAVSRKGSQEAIASVEAGGFVGEVALLQDAPRNATVTSSADSVVLALGRDQFREIVAGDFLAGLRLEAAAARRAIGSGT